MDKTIHTLNGKVVQRKLVELRKMARLTHRELAVKLEREHSIVWRIEHGERRLDVVEFYAVCKALGVDAAAIYGELVQEFDRMEKPKERKRRPVSE